MAETKDEILHVLPGIWIRKSQRDIMEEWERERSKQFRGWFITGKTTTQMKFNNTPNKCIKADGKEYWVSRAMAVVGLTFAYVGHKPYLLISQRGPGAADNHGKWNIPCGYLDYDETLEEAVCRELYEETGLDIPAIKADNLPNVYMGEIHHIFTNDDPKKDARQNVSFWYKVTINAESEEDLPVLLTVYSEPDEVSDVRWVPFYRNELDKYDFAFNHRERLEEFTCTKKLPKLYDSIEAEEEVVKKMLDSLQFGLESCKTNEEK